jgi:hypothetical protein
MLRESGDVFAKLSPPEMQAIVALLPATMGELAWESGDAGRAAACFRAALACECSEPQRRFLERRLRELGIRNLESGIRN